MAGDLGAASQGQHGHSNTCPKPALTEQAEFDGERARRYFGRYVLCLYIFGSTVWLPLALTTLNLADIPYAA